MKWRIFCIIAVSGLGSIAGCDKSPGAKPNSPAAPEQRPAPLPILPVQQQPVSSTDQTPLPPLPGAVTVSPPPPVAINNIEKLIDAAKSNIQMDVTALAKAEKGCFDRLNANPKYIAAMSAKAEAAEKVRQAVQDGTGGDEYKAMVAQLNQKMQALVDARRSILDSDTIVLDARRKVANDESEFEALLKQKGIQVAAAPPTPAQIVPPHDSGASALFPDTLKSGGTYVPGYYQQDGTYVPPHYQP